MKIIITKKLILQHVFCFLFLTQFAYGQSRNNYQIINSDPIRTRNSDHEKKPGVSLSATQTALSPGELTVSGPGNLFASVKQNNNAAAVAPLSGYYFESFEGVTFPPSGWQVLDIQDATYAWLQSTVSVHSGTHSAYMNFTSNVAITGEDWLIMPKFAVASTDSVFFWMAVQAAGYPPDSTFILVSTTDSLMSSFTNVLATLAEGNGYPTISGEFHLYSYSLSAFTGQDVYVAFKNTNNYGDGIFLDDVAIGTFQDDVAPTGIVLPRYLLIGGTTSPVATIQNNSFVAQSFPVTMTNTNGYSSTKNIVNLAGGSSVQVTFDQCTTSVAGIETFHVQTQLASDLASFNDTMSLRMSVCDSFPNYGWVSKAPMTTAKYDVAASSLTINDTSYLMIIGGATLTSTGGIYEVNRYTPDSNSWLVLPPIATWQYAGKAARIGNYVYLAGGYWLPNSPNSTLQVFNISAGTWTTASPMPTPVGDYAIGVYHDSLIYYMGGYTGSYDSYLVEIYNPGTDTWTYGSHLPVPGWGWSAGIIGNKIVITGGHRLNVGARANTYIGIIDPANPTLISWTNGMDYPAGPFIRGGSGVSLDDNSGLILFTGGDPDGSAASALDKTFAYDVNSGTWKIGPNKISPANNLNNFTPIVYNDSLWMAACGGFNGTVALDANEWLNLGPYITVTGTSHISSPEIKCTNYPNPFDQSTNISFSLKQASDVKVTMTDILGNQIQELCNKSFSSGEHRIIWNAEKFSKGIYFCKFLINGRATTLKLLKF